MKQILIFFSLLVFFATDNVEAKMMTVNSKRVNLRSQPNTHSKIKWVYEFGFPVKVIGKQGSWSKIRDFENDTGWINNKLLSDIPHLIVKIGKTNKKRINIRSGPGTKYKIVGKAHYGVVFKTIKQKKGWAQVKHETGVSGWIMRSLLWGF